MVKLNSLSLMNNSTAFPTSLEPSCPKEIPSGLSYRIPSEKVCITTFESVIAVYKDHIQTTVVETLRSNSAVAFDRYNEGLRTGFIDIFLKNVKRSAIFDSLYRLMLNRPLPIIDTQYLCAIISTAIEGSSHYKSGQSKETADFRYSGSD